MTDDTSLYAGTLRGFRHWGLNMTSAKFYALSLQVPKPNVWGLDLSSPGYGHTPASGVNEATCGILDKYKACDRHTGEWDGDARLLSDIRGLTADLARHDDPPVPDHYGIPTSGFGLPSAGYLKKRLALLTAYAEDRPHPFRDCQCGFYASYIADENFYYPRNKFAIGMGSYMQVQKLGGVTPIQGVVECHGKIVLGTKGFRAQRMEIKALCVDGMFKPYGAVCNEDLMEALEYMCASRHPEARWYGLDQDAMHADWPANDTSGLPVHVDKNYAA